MTWKLKPTLQNAQVWIAYNRRFYASTLRAEEMIAEDGGVTSFHFEFTKWSAKSKQKAPVSHGSLGSREFFSCVGPGVSLRLWSQKNWRDGREAALIGIQRHPEELWGKSGPGALFSYFADWEAPGRWGVVVMTL